MKRYRISRLVHSRGRFVRGLLVVSLLGAIPGAASAAPIQNDAVDARFIQVDDLAATRWSAAAVPLADGRVLLAGGIWLAGYGLRDAEVFDPATATWSQTGDMLLPRFGMGMTALHDGRVMVVGGVSSGDCAWKGFSDRSEIWDPATGAFTTSETMTMAVPRVAAAVVILSDGRVLAAGGWNRCGTVYDSVEVFDPVTETWTQAGELNVPRYAAAPLLLPDGRVLLAGGIGGDPYPALDSVEIYDPVTGTWSLTGSMLTSRYWSGDDYSGSGDLTRLADGTILAAGGVSRECNNWYTCSPFTYLDSAELYDPATGTWNATGSMGTPRGAHRTVLLGNGTVLAVGGYNGTNTLSSAEVYEPASGMWAPTAEMVIGRSEAVAVPLPDGSALVASGYSGYHDLASTEVFSLGGKLNKVVNAGFESGPGIAWREESDDRWALVTRNLPRTSEFGARLGARDNGVDYVEQEVTIPADGRLQYCWYMTSTDSTTEAKDFLRVAAYKLNGQLLRVLRLRSNTSQRDQWVRDIINLSGGAGLTIRLRFSATTDSSNPTYFYIDDVTLK